MLAWLYNILVGRFCNHLWREKSKVLSQHGNFFCGEVRECTKCGIIKTFKYQGKMMTREEFTKRLEEVGFKYINMCHTYDFATNNKYYQVHLADNKDIFIVPERSSYEIYFFDELEQFLIDKGIVEKPFNAHEYLERYGYTLSQYLNNYVKMIGNFVGIIEIKYEEQKVAVFLNPKQDITYYFDGITQKNIDKAVRLIYFLIELEKE